MKTKKPPPSTPAVGDRVRLKGRPPVGLLVGLNGELWAWVDWDAGAKGPNICHLNELEKSGQ